MSCPICNSPDYIRCNCEVTVPYCDPCTTNNSCIEKFDAECVFYHRDDDRATKLTCLGISNKTSVEEILETIDTFICQMNATQIPITPIDTESVNITAFSTLKHTIQADINVSAATGNTLVINSDGLYVSNASGHTYTADQGIELEPTDHNLRLVEVLDGAATKFLWNYTKAAFRAGEVTGVQWNNSGIGQYSAAFGLDTVASGTGSFAAGRSSTTIGDYSVVFGQSNINQAPWAVDFGLSNTIGLTADASILAGNSLTTTQPYSSIFGRSSSAAASTTGLGGSFVAGVGSHTTGDVTSLVGSGHLVSSNYSTSIGYGNVINHTTAGHSHAYGRGLVTNLAYHVVLGLFNDDTDEADDTAAIGVNTDVAVTIGAGYITGVVPFEVIVPQNGLVIYKDQTVRIYGALDQRGSPRGIMPANWTTVNRPAAPKEGEFGYNTTDNKLEYWNAVSWVQW